MPSITTKPNAGKAKTIKNKPTKKPTNTFSRFFSKKQNIVLVTFILMFGVIGSFMVFRSHAQVVVKGGYAQNDPVSCGMDPQFRNARGKCTQVLQASLNYIRAKDNLSPISADGVFGLQTETAVKDFQRSPSAGVPATGFVDAQTWIYIATQCSNRGAFGYNDSNAMMNECKIFVK